ncbi:MAG: argininosuccinate synthase [Xanthomonadales bacterium]|nr:Argininosuccinate synthase [Xanthomonadales bacterium]MCC6594235.1 argininosuccinate synthase [Xanthomonadales bacterium]MCE7930838.1 argininosuccinate synthase [Xanthomonadales bacterium PRO6]
MSQPLCVLAFSGGLDTSFCVLHLRERGFDVATVTVNTGGFDAAELARIEAAAHRLGVAAHRTIDARQELWNDYLRYLLYGNVLRGQLYPLSVSAERVCQAKRVAEVANELGAAAIAHGSTGAGNDQVRFDVAFRALCPDKQLITPIRELALSREDETRWLAERGVVVPAKTTAYSVNEGMWGTSVGGRETHDSWQHLPDSAYPGGAIASDLPPRTLALGFEHGEPVSLDGQALGAVAIVAALNALGERYGIGRGIHLGDTILGIKGRVGFSAPAAHLLIQAHRELEKLVLSGKQLFWKESLGNLYGSLLHEGHYFDPVGRDLEAYLASSQASVSGDVRMTLYPRVAQVEGVRSPHSLMQSRVASYGEGAKAWTGEEARGYCKLFGVAQQVALGARSARPVSGVSSE